MEDIYDVIIQDNFKIMVIWYFGEENARGNNRGLLTQKDVLLIMVIKHLTYIGGLEFLTSICY